MVLVKGIYINNASGYEYKGSQKEAVLDIQKMEFINYLIDNFPKFMVVTYTVQSTVTTAIIIHLDSIMNLRLEVKEPKEEQIKEIPHKELSQFMAKFL